MTRFYLIIMLVSTLVSISHAKPTQRFNSRSFAHHFSTARSSVRVQGNYELQGSKYLRHIGIAHVNDGKRKELVMLGIVPCEDQPSDECVKKFQTLSYQEKSRHSIIGVFDLNKGNQSLINQESKTFSLQGMKHPVIAMNVTETRKLDRAPPIKEVES